MKEPTRVSGKPALEKLTEFTRRIFAVPKEEITEKVQEPIYRPRKRKRRNRAIP